MRKIILAAGSALGAAEKLCDHKWEYQGTDYHGSHKGEHSYRCRRCRKREYRHD